MKIALALLVVLPSSPPIDEPLKATVEALIRDSGAEAVAVAYRDRKSGEEILIRPDESFHAASTMKLAVLAEVYRRAREGTLSLDEPIAIRADFASIADGIRYALDPADDSEPTLYRRLGQVETVRELARLMIVRSSNLATNLLVERVTAPAVAAFMKRIGAGGIVVLRGVEDGPAFARGMNNTATARGLGRLLTLLADRAVVSPESSDAMVAVLLGQAFAEGIPAGLPAGTPVAHKTGSIRRAYHDAAIVMPPGRPPYVLVVLTRGLDDEAKAHRLVAAIARAVHDRAVRP